MIRIGFDVDGVLALFEPAYGRLIERISGKRLFPEDWQDMVKQNTFPTVWDWDQAAGYTRADSSAAWKSIKADPNFWSDLDHYPDVLEVARQLRTKPYKSEVYFITHRMGTCVKLQTENWLLDRGFSNPTVLIAGDKIPLINSLELDVYIDDKPETVEDAVANTKTRIYLMDRPYNREVTVGERVTSIEAMLKREGLWT